MRLLKLSGLILVTLLVFTPAASAEIPIVATINDDPGDTDASVIDITQTGYIAGNVFVVSTVFEETPVLNHSIFYTLAITFYADNQTKTSRINLVVSNNETQATFSWGLNSSNPNEDVSTTVDTTINNETLVWEIDPKDFDDSIFGEEDPYWYNFYLEVSIEQPSEFEDTVNFQSNKDTNTEPLVSPVPTFAILAAIVILPVIKKFRQ